MSQQTLPPRRTHNKHEREYEYVTHDEFKAIHKAAGSIGRHPQRDALMIAMAFRHGLRATEVVSLDWKHLDLKRRTFDVFRAKGGKRGVHDLHVKEVAALRKLQPDPQNRISGPVFLTERGGALTTNGFFKVVQRAGQVAGITRPLHPHCLRHGCGFYMTDKGVHLRVIQDWLGHQNIQMTCRYTDLAPGRLRGAFPDED
jgi:type 1 fimbriae regulatory protein FimB/type 1 fimbriae regulatory protein FimE